MNADLEQAIHALAQPLTSLSFLLDAAAMKPDASVWREVLETARVECERAVIALQSVRFYAHSEAKATQAADRVPCQRSQP